MAHIVLHKGETIPDGWVLNAEGKPTTESVYDENTT